MVKISALTPLADVADVDVYPVVDISTGTTKKARRDRTVRTYANVTALLAASDTYTAGAVVRTEEEGFAYTAVASGGDVTNGTQGFTVQPLPGGRFIPSQFGGVDGGVTDATTAVQAAADAAKAINTASGQLYGSIDLDGKQWLVTSKVTFQNINSRGNGGSLYATGNHAIVELIGSKCTHENWQAWYSTATSNTSREAIQLCTSDNTKQFSKNVLINVITRNGYRGWAAASTGGACWGNTFINCRGDNSWDWSAYFDFPTGTTTNTFINWHCRPLLNVGDPKGMYINNCKDVCMINFAADQVQIKSATDFALQVVNSQHVNIDMVTLESCEILTSGGELVNISGGHLSLGHVLSVVGLYQPGAGNDSYIVGLGSTTTVAEIGTITMAQDQAGATGTQYALSTNNTTVVRSEVPFAEVDTNGNQHLYYDRTRLTGFRNSIPAGGSIAYVKGDIAWNLNPGAGESAGWICTAAGTPGTWAPFGPIKLASGIYAPTNVSTDRSYDADSTTLDEIADVLGTLIADLQAASIIQ